MTVALVGTATGRAGPSRHWDVTFAIRLTGGDGRPIAIRLALPVDSPLQRISDVRVVERGLQSTVVRDGPTPHVRFSGRLTGSRRVAVRYHVESQRDFAAIPPVPPLHIPPPELLPFISPAPLFQSRSILVREFLETHAAPGVAATTTDLLRIVLATTRNQLEWQKDGKSLPLDVIRRRGGRRIGIERVFTTFLRCAHIPARFVEGIKLDSPARRKRIFWTEVWADGRWWPVSASRGWIGRRRGSYLAVSRDGVRILDVEGPADASYTVHTTPIEDTP